MNCPYCHSGFLEEFGPTTSRLSGRDLRLGLSDEQARRLNNAATLLQILEAQLREELDHLQSAFLAAEARKSAPLTKRMLDSLKNTNITVDMICCQPCCPICSEDYILGEIATLLPCTHVYHRACVLPWLEQKRTCPICRFELKDSIPSLEELIRLPRPELVDRLDQVHITDNLEDKNNIQLAQLLYEELVRQCEAREAAEIAAADQDEWRQAMEEERAMDEMILAHRREAVALAEAAAALEEQNMGRPTETSTGYGGEVPSRSGLNGSGGARSGFVRDDDEEEDRGDSDLDDDMTDEEVRSLIYHQAGFGNPSGYVPPSSTRTVTSTAARQGALQATSYTTSNSSNREEPIVPSSSSARSPRRPQSSSSSTTGTMTASSVLAGQASRPLVVPTGVLTGDGSNGSHPSSQLSAVTDSPPRPFIRPQFSSNRRLSASGDSLMLSSSLPVVAVIDDLG